MPIRESSGASPKMDFRSAAVGANSPSHALKVFNNNLFSPDLGLVGSGLSGGTWITKINGCLECCEERPKLVIPLEMIAEDIDYYSKHALLCKFMGMQVYLQFLESWAQRTWMPEGEMEVMLLANNFFMVSFNCLADRNKAFEGGPYFHNQIRLFIKPWHAGFNPAEELPNRVPVWVRLPKFSVECWQDDVLHLLASMLGKPVGASQQTQVKKVT